MLAPLRAGLIACAVGLVLFILDVAMWPVQAFWIDEGGYTDPYNPNPVHCCSSADCKRMAASDVKWTPAGWLHIPTGEVFGFDQTYVTMPAGGDGVWWVCLKSQAYYGHLIRCLFRPDVAG